LRYRTEIDARMTEFEETLHEIKTKMEKREENMKDIGLDDTIRKHKKAKDKLKDLERADDRNWKKVKDEIDKLYEDIGEELRKAITYYVG
jgi:F0F1-type ATP synthase membrane subunit b/b'